MRRFLYDTAVFLYAVGREHPYREPCRRLVELAAAGVLHGEASVELLQEYAHVRSRRSGDREAAAREARDVAALCRLHDVTRSDLLLGLSLFASLPRLEMRDALHAATALERGVFTIVSPDRAFDDVPGLERLDPSRAEVVLLG
ncbi:MAG TPA: type II toxin-antitoxin system VapC family toxin [Thermoanaerobaculia bacterium]|nr:type II toxin-antitoxin system VapC family toxin [Thermoanaerobaculia bacterium]